MEIEVSETCLVSNSPYLTRVVTFSAHGLGRRTDVKIHQWRRIAEEKMESFETALGRIPPVEGQKGENQFVEVFRRRCVYRTPSAPLPPKAVGRHQSFNSVVSSLRGFVWGSPLQRCTSPEPMTKCSGECPARPKNEAPTMPNAVCFVTLLFVRSYLMLQISSLSLHATTQKRYGRCARRTATGKR